MKELELRGKTAVLRGADSLCRAVALGLAEAGADIALIDRDVSKLKQTAREVEDLGRRALAIPCDTLNSQQLKGAVQRCISAFGGIDILVNGSFWEHARPLLSITKKEWHRLIDMNLTSLFLACQVIGEHMAGRNQGRIVNIISGLAMRGAPNHTAFCATMGGVLQFTRAMALEWARSGISANVLAVGWFGDSIPSRDEQTCRLLAGYVPLRRLGQPWEAATLAVLLASDAASHITGQTFSVDGGLSIRG